LSVSLTEDSVVASYHVDLNVRNRSCLEVGRPTKYHITMDSVVGDRVVHEDLDVRTFGHPNIDERGKIGGALRLDGTGQYVSLGAHHDACLGNLDLCRHGLLLAGWLRPGTLRDGMDLVSTGANGIRLRYVGGRMRATARTSAHIWMTQTDAVRPDRWHFVEVAWSDEAGLALYVDNRLVARASRGIVRPTSGGAVRPSPDREQFYLGRGDGTLSNSRYGNMTVDELEYWYGSRDYLLAFDYIQRGFARLYLFIM